MWWLAEEKGVGEVEEGKGGINGGGRRLDLGWTRNTIHRWCIIELYTWNLYNLIDQCYPSKFTFKKGKTKEKTTRTNKNVKTGHLKNCLLYTSDAADDCWMV